MTALEAAATGAAPAPTYRATVERRAESHVCACAARGVGEDRVEDDAARGVQRIDTVTDSKVILRTAAMLPRPEVRQDAKAASRRTARVMRCQYSLAAFSLDRSSLRFIGRVP
jgi:hypothetical protein